MWEAWYNEVMMMRKSVKKMGYTKEVVIYFGSYRIMIKYEDVAFTNEEPFVMGLHCLIEEMYKEVTH